MPARCTSAAATDRPRLSADATLIGGIGFFAAALRTAGNQTLTATDTVNGSLTNTSASIAVTAVAATHFVVSAPANAITGNGVNFTVTAKDAFNNTAAGYAGTVHFTSTDSAASLPANATLTNGMGVFSVTLKSRGSQTLTATDLTTPSITGTSNTIATREPHRRQPHPHAHRIHRHFRQTVRPLPD